MIIFVDAPRKIMIRGLPRYTREEANATNSRALPYVWFLDMWVPQGILFLMRAISSASLFYSGSVYAIPVTIFLCAMEIADYCAFRFIIYATGWSDSHPLGVLPHVCGWRNAATATASEPEIPAEEHKPRPSFHGGELPAKSEGLDKASEFEKAILFLNDAAEGVAQACGRPFVDCDAEEEARMLSVVLANVQGVAKSLSADAMKPIIALFVDYDPVSYDEPGDGSQERELRTRLEAVLRGGTFTQIEAPPNKFRCVKLGKVLSPKLWTSNTSEQGLASTLGQEASSATDFISHAWKDEGGRKVYFLRLYLCLNQLLAALLSVSFVTALEVLPIGMALQSEFSVPPYALSVAVLVLLAVALSWVALSWLEMIPEQLRPWAFSDTTIWLDKCCIDQSDVQGSLNRLADDVLMCDRMIVLASEHYFKRLWCVYELATFLKKHHGNLEEKLTILNLAWSPFSPFKWGDLSEKEMSWISEFKCQEAVCRKPSDRALVLAWIRRLWGSEAIFESFVRAEFPKAFEAGKRKFKWAFYSEVRRVLRIMLD